MMTSDMWRVIFYERVGGRLHTDRTGPWLPNKQMAQNWANWFGALGYHVALQNQGGELHRISLGLPN
ncbi:hypothetical protein [Roseateles sp. PN1]|uniref:hypothetical protein n=1 Tax=Roseateles sp. PN1 TaxID=3137372 RepID=UPI003139CC14